MTNNDESFLSASSSTSRTHLLLKRNQTSSTSTSSTTTSFFELPLPRVSSHLVESFKSSHTRDLINLNLFDFNAPYQARTLERDKISFRTQPASSSLSKSQLSQQQITNLTPTRSHPYMRATSPPSLTSSKSDTIKSSSSPTCGSSSNAILAQLKSISSNFKSIFVRPKTHKPIGNLFFFSSLNSLYSDVREVFFLVFKTRQLFWINPKCIENMCSISSMTFASLSCSAQHTHCRE